MNTPQTEQKHHSANDLDLRSNEEILQLLATGQAQAAGSVAHSLPQISAAATLVAQSFSGSGRLIYAAAGSSALMALADALELPGTYGIDVNRIVVLFAGGADMLRHLIGGPEDDAAAGAAEAQALQLTAEDCVIVLSASGRTPYALAVAEVARTAGARVIGLANNPDTPLAARSDVAIALATPPEVIAGSTRMGAGTSQKIALNMISTLAALRLGHVHDGYMVNVVADNAKLVSRAKIIITGITGVDDACAEAALTTAKGEVKAAILLCAGATDLPAAKALLEQFSGHLRPALSALAIAQTSLASA